MHPRNAGGKRNSQPSTEGDLPEKGSCNEIGQETLSGGVVEGSVPPALR